MCNVLGYGDVNDCKPDAPVALLHRRVSSRYNITRRDYLTSTRASLGPTYLLRNIIESDEDVNLISGGVSIQCLPASVAANV